MMPQEQPYCYCGGAVPVLPVVMAAPLLRNMTPAQRQSALQLALQWLVTPHPGLRSYQRIRGRAYTPEEQDSFALEVAPAAATACPFMTPTGGCAVGCLTAEAMQPRPKVTAGYGFLPALIARELDLEGYRALIDQGVIADAKIALLDRNTGFPTRAAGSIIQGRDMQDRERQRNIL